MMKKKRMEGNSRSSCGGRIRSSKKESALAVDIRKGPWQAEEDEGLMNHVNSHCPRDWSSLRSKGLLRRTRKSCHLPWVNKLRPNLKNGCKFSVEEERIVIELQSEFGNKCARIATFLQGRTDNDVKNFWSSRQKRLARILHAQALANPSSFSASTRPQRKKKESFLPQSHDVQFTDNLSISAANHRDNPSDSTNDIPVADDGNLAHVHVFCPKFSNAQLGFYFGVEHQCFLPTINDPNFELVNGGQFSPDSALFQGCGSCLNSTMDEKTIVQSCTFMEDLLTDMSNRFEHLPSPSRW